LEFLAAHKLEELLEVHEVKSGDTFFVPAGTPHTIGPDMVLCEVQEYSDVTYRLYDYGRIDAQGKPRDLHVEKALEVMDFPGPRGGKVASVSLPAERWSRKLLAACQYFATERWEFRTTVQTESDRARFELFVVLAGTGYIHWKGSPILYGQGQCWLIPASLGQFSLQPEQSTTLLRTYVPNLSDLAAELEASGVSGAQLVHTVFA
jgi:mannose-6-phosphate isomerase